jgi:putative transposase
MTGYRRNFVAGGSFFFTVNLAERRLELLTQHIDELRTAFRETRRHHPFTIDAVAVLPDHLHTVSGRSLSPTRILRRVGGRSNRHSHAAS